MNVGRLAISFDLLRCLLRLPEGVTILSVVPPTADDAINAQFSIILGGDGLPKHIVGAPIQHVSLTSRTNGPSTFSD